MMLMNWRVLAAIVVVGIGLPSFAAAADYTGVWQATSPRSASGANMPPLTARARADFEAFDPLDDPVIRCVPAGFPRTGLIIYPFEIVQTDELIVFLYESNGIVRHIYMDGREIPEYMPPAKSGYSMGRWEGEELVVTTTRIEPAILSFGGVPQYGDLEVIERYRLVNDGEGLEAEVTITAPETITEPWTRTFTWELDPEGMIFEWSCDPEDSRF